MRIFETGATRDADAGKPDYEGFESPLVEEMFGRYMLRHQTGPDGQPRASDNWQKGIPLDAYLKSLVRHVHDLRKLHRGYPVTDPKTGHPVTLEEALCACRFNVNGYMHELEKRRQGQRECADTSAELLCLKVD